MSDMNTTAGLPKSLQESEIRQYHKLLDAFSINDDGDDFVLQGKANKGSVVDISGVLALVNLGIAHNATEYVTNNIRTLNIPKTKVVSGVIKNVLTADKIRSSEHTI